MYKFLSTILVCISVAALAKEEAAPSGSEFFKSSTYGGLDFGTSHVKAKARVRIFPNTLPASTYNFKKSKNAFVYGAHVGRHEMIGQWMHGLELKAHFHTNKLKNTSQGLNNINVQDILDRQYGFSMALTGGRLLCDRLLVYGKLGADFSRFRLTHREQATPSSPVGRHRRNKGVPGFVVGGGLDFAFTDKVTARVEMEYTAYSRVKGRNVGTNVQPSRVYQHYKPTTATATVGISYRYGATKYKNLLTPSSEKEKS